MIFAKKKESDQSNKKIKGESKVEDSELLKH